MGKFDAKPDPSRSPQEEAAYWRRVANGTAREARSWKQRYEELASRPDPGLAYLQEQLRRAHDKLRSASAIRSRTTAANRKSAAFIFGAKMRGRGKSLDEVLSYGVGEGDDVRLFASDGWHWVDKLLRTQAVNQVVRGG